MKIGVPRAQDEVSGIFVDFKGAKQGGHLLGREGIQ